MADYYDRGYPGGGGGGGGYPGGEPSYLSELLSRDEELVGGIFYQCLAVIICSITPPTFLIMFKSFFPCSGRKRPSDQGLPPGEDGFKRRRMGEEPDLAEIPPATLRILVRNQDAGGIIGKVGEGRAVESRTMWIIVELQLYCVCVCVCGCFQS